MIVFGLNMNAPQPFPTARGSMTENNLTITFEFDNGTRQIVERKVQCIFVRLPSGSSIRIWSDDGKNLTLRSVSHRMSVEPKVDGSALVRLG